MRSAYELHSERLTYNINRFLELECSTPLNLPLGLCVNPPSYLFKRPMFLNIADSILHTLRHGKERIAHFQSAQCFHHWSFIPQIAGTEAKYILIFVSYSYPNIKKLSRKTSAEMSCNVVFK